MNTKQNVNEPLPASDLLGALAAIPRADLISMIVERVWSTGGREIYNRQGYSLWVDEETSLRDVIYRDAPLYPTPEEAIVAHWRTHYAPNVRPLATPPPTPQDHAQP